MNNEVTFIESSPTTGSNHPVGGWAGPGFNSLPKLDLLGERCGGRNSRNTISN